MSYYTVTTYHCPNCNKLIGGLPLTMLLPWIARTHMTCRGCGHLINTEPLRASEWIGWGIAWSIGVYVLLWDVMASMVERHFAWILVFVLAFPLCAMPFVALGDWIEGERTQTFSLLGFIIWLASILLLVSIHWIRTLIP